MTIRKAAEIHLSRNIILWTNDTNSVISEFFLPIKNKTIGIFFAVKIYVSLRDEFQCLK